MRMSSLQLVFSLSALFFLPDAVHARPIELSDFRRVPVSFQRLADQFATTDAKFEDKNRGWGLGLIFRRPDSPSADATAAGYNTGSLSSVGGASANGRALGHRSGLFVQSGRRGLQLGALDSPGQPGLRLGTLDLPGQPGLRLGIARQSDNSSDLLVTGSPQGENSVKAVPESSTMTLFGSSFVALFLVRFRQSMLL